MMAASLTRKLPRIFMIRAVSHSYIKGLTETPRVIFVVRRSFPQLAPLNLVNTVVPATRRQHLETWRARWQDDEFTKCKRRHCGEVRMPRITISARTDLRLFYQLPNECVFNLFGLPMPVFFDFKQCVGFAAFTILIWDHIDTFTTEVRACSPFLHSHC